VERGLYPAKRTPGGILLESPLQGLRKEQGGKTVKLRSDVSNRKKGKGPTKNPPGGAVKSGQEKKIRGEGQGTGDP